MAEATCVKDANANTYDVTAPEALSAGEVFQLPCGRAAVTAALAGIASGKPAAGIDAGKFTVAKTTGVVWLDGAPIWWDRSANTATPLKAAAGADYYLGVAVGDATSAATEGVVDLNVKPVYTLDLLNLPSLDTVSGDATVVSKPGAIEFTMTSTSEVQKCDAMSIHSIPVVSGSAIPFIVEGRMAIWSVGSDATVDMNVGLANETHGTDAGTIAESVFVHFNNALDIFLESDDGGTEVAETNSTIDGVDDTYFDFAFDCRDLTDIQIYINGVLMLGSTTFALDAATGPIKLLAHMEKTTGAATGVFRVAQLTARTTDVT